MDAMDPVAHAFSGSAAAAAGLRRVTPLATAALVLGAIAPDIDAVLMFGDEFHALAHRRGLTHGIAAVFALPLFIVPVLVAWDRYVRRRRDPAAAPARPVALYWLAAAAVALHLAFDWINNYGVRLLMPFDGRWFYGDALFVIDPWLWLLLGGVSFLAWSARTPALAAWSALWLLLSWPVFTSELVGASARALWVIGLAGIVVIRWRWHGQGGRSPVRQEMLARVGLGLAIAYILLAVAANAPARREIAAVLVGEGIAVSGRIMIAPVPGRPLAGFVVAETPAGYVLGDWHWRAQPRFEVRRNPLPARLDRPEVVAAAATPAARDFLTWSRFPYAEVETAGDDVFVRFRDARYAGGRGGIPGPTVRLAAGSLSVLDERGSD